MRRLRIFAFDPALASRFDYSDISKITVSVPWEKLGPGPIGEYIEVVDVDPASGMAYHPVDLDAPEVLAADGLHPSEGVPQFHQQMVYAVAMTTIDQFERALGRVALWKLQRRKLDDQGDNWEWRYIPRLRIYPHALRAENAYYSPDKCALLFGYFPVSRKDRHNTPGTLVFTCLSHDIVAHEVTHALLDGVHPRFNEPTNPDVHAFHEAFADIVALFQHFTYPGVLRAELARTRGDLAAESLLGELAQQFGRATGHGGALRGAIGAVNEATGQWEMHRPDPRALDDMTECHERGAILVAAVFRAYIRIYAARTSDLFRIATGGTGIPEDGALHPDLVNRLADEAAKAARHVLQMCIRAIDYCPPVDITFGDYLRALVTADVEYDAQDERDYRTAFIESFREWGIHPRDMRSMSVEALLWPSGSEAIPDDLHGFVREILSQADSGLADWRLDSDRALVASRTQEDARKLWDYFIGKQGFLQEAVTDVDTIKSRILKAIGLAHHTSLGDQRATVFSSNGEKPLSQTVATEVHSVRPALRRTLRGEITTDLVVEITQRRAGYFSEAEQTRRDRPDAKIARSGKPSREDYDFIFRRGCTLIIDPVRAEIRRVIRTPGDVSDNAELARVRGYLTGDAFGPGNAFDSVKERLNAREPFALLHATGEE